MTTSKKRKHTAYEAWLEQKEDELTISVELSDGKLLVVEKLFLSQCRQAKLACKKCPSQKAEPFFLRDFTRATFVIFRALLYSDQMPSLKDIVNKEEFKKWSEVYALCDFLDFSRGKNQIVDQVKKHVSWNHVLPLLDVLSMQPLKYLEIWHLLLLKIIARKTEIENILKWPTGVINCYDSLKPGEGPRDKKDLTKGCCTHDTSSQGIVLYYGSPLCKLLELDDDDDENAQRVENSPCCKHGDGSESKEVRHYHQAQIKENIKWLETLTTLPEAVQVELHQQALLATSKKLNELC